MSTILNKIRVLESERHILRLDYKENDKVLKDKLRELRLKRDHERELERVTYERALSPGAVKDWLLGAFTGSEALLGLTAAAVYKHWVDTDGEPGVVLFGEIMGAMGFDKKVIRVNDKVMRVYNKRA